MVEIQSEIEADRKRLEEKKDMEEGEKKKIEEDLVQKEEELKKAQYGSNLMLYISSQYGILVIKGLQVV